MIFRVEKVDKNVLAASEIVHLKGHFSNLTVIYLGKMQKKATENKVIISKNRFIGYFSDNSLPAIQ